MAASYRRPRRTLDIWPGYVDALATLLIIIIFVLMAFVLSQFLLGHLLTGRNEALARLGHQLQALNNQLVVEKTTNADLTKKLQSTTSELAAMFPVKADRDALAAQVIEQNKTIDVDKEKLKVQLDQLTALQADIKMLQAMRDEMTAKIGAQEGGLTREQQQNALLSQQLATLSKELARLNAALGAAETVSTNQKVQIANLGQRLNQVMAEKVEELSRYRSEFFGRLREVLGTASGVRIEGDRFVFQSEVLFTSASADIGTEGQVQLGKLAATLMDIAKRIPPGVKWVLRVDGHTDKVRIANSRYPSNWELSTARALSVVKFLISRGIPSERLAATGFGEYQPIDNGSDAAALRRNRRIELRLDQR
ncbi:MAG: peptidoglycan -binding protein [Alphaproteobacteria bacterium]|nr:peptidoglycan -binding protein [Alphaproteobacteria bacterium]